MNLRKHKLFQREKMQSLEPKDYLKVGVISGIIILPVLVTLVI